MILDGGWSGWWDRIEKRFLPAHAWESDLLTLWRERILMSICLTAVVLGPVSLVPSLILSYAEKRWDIFALGLAAYAAALLILRGRDYPLNRRVGLALFMLYFLGCCLLIALGPFGAGYIWLFGASVMAGALIGFRAAIWSLVFNFLALTAIGVLVAADIPAWAGKIDLAPGIWLVVQANFMLLNSLVTLTTAMMLRGLQGALVQERKSGEDLRRGEERFRLIVENLPVLIVGYDARGAAALWNSECERVTGFAAAEVYGAPLLDLISDLEPEDPGIETGEVEHESPRELEKEIRCRDGSSRIVAWKDLTNLVKLPGLHGWAAGIDVSRKKAAERELRETSIKHWIIFNKATEGIMVIQDGLFKFFNRKTADLIGYDPLELRKKSDVTFLEWVHPADRETVAERYAGRQRGEAVPTEYQIRIINKKGETLWVEISSTVIQWEKRTATLTFMNDIMERKRAEDLLRESERRFKEMANMLPTIIVELAPDGRVLYSNQAGFDAFKYSPEEAAGGLLISELVVADDLPRVREIFRRAVEQGLSSGGFECRLHDKNRDQVTCLAQVRPMYYNEVIRGARASLMDITDIKRTRFNLEASEEKYRDILESIEEGYYEVDLKGRLTFFNQGLAVMAGYSAEELRGLDYHRIMDRETAEEAFRAFLNVYKTKQPSSAVDWVIVKKDGTEILVETSLSLIKNPLGEPLGFRGVARDVTQRKKLLEAEEKRVLAEAANQAKTDFLARMSHEIRTPINAVLGLTELALAEDQSERQRKILETIGSESLALINLVNRILDFSKIEARKMELESIPFQLDYLLENIADSMAVEAHKKDLEFILYLAPDAPTKLVGDPGMVRQILTNLLGNAVKFTHQGEIYLKVEKLEQSRDRARLAFSIKDTGIGIAAEKQKTIFDAFTQADGSTTRHYGGTGLGVTISQKLAELMGGEITLESREGSGSTFSFTASFELQPESGPAARALPTEDLSGKTILLVDDNPTYRAVLKSYLQSWGCLVLEASGIEEALAELENQGPGENITLILSDLRQSEQTGIDLAAAVKERPRLAGVPIIVLANVGRLGDGRRCREIGVRGYLTKPVRRDDLLRIIRVVLGTGDKDGRDAAPTATRHSVAEMDRFGLNILLVEDYPTNQVIALEHLRNDGHRVELARNGREAVDAFQRRRFDLVLMDIQMPIMDGYAATQKIREIENKIGAPPGQDGRPRRLPIIAMTAHAFKGYREKCLDAGMDDYITKPLLREELLNLVRRWSPNVARFPNHEPPLPAAPPAPPDGFSDEAGDPGAPPLDLAAAVREFMGKEDLVKEICGQFLENVQAQIARMREAAPNGELEAIWREAHSIKGGAGNLTARPLSRAAAALEQSAKSGHTKEVYEFLEAVEAEFARLRDFLLAAGFVR
ncbi:MAG: PAS domain S-box protein [Pseudomonadota bacterium]